MVAHSSCRLFTHKKATEVPDIVIFRIALIPYQPHIRTHPSSPQHTSTNHHYYPRSIVPARQGSSRRRHAAESKVRRNITHSLSCFAVRIFSTPPAYLRSAHPRLPFLPSPHHQLEPSNLAQSRSSCLPLPYPCTTAPLHLVHTTAASPWRIN